MYLVDLETAKAWLPHLVETSGPGASGLSDADFQRYIEAASTTAERVAARKLAARDYVEVYSGASRPSLVVANFPIQSVTEIKVDSRGNFDTAEAFSEYEIEPETGALLRRSGWPKGYRNIRVEYRAGYELDSVAGADYHVPDDLTRAVCEVIDWMYQRDRNQTIGIRTTIGADGLQTSYSLDVPMSARSVFEGYREVRV